MIAMNASRDFCISFSKTKFLVNHFVYEVSVVRLGNEHVDAVPGFEPSAVEVVFHRKAGSQQSHAGKAASAHLGAGGIRDVQHGNPNRRFHLWGDPVHRIRTQNEEICPSRFNALGGLRQEYARLLQAPTIWWRSIASKSTL